MFLSRKYIRWVALGLPMVTVMFIAYFNLTSPYHLTRDSTLELNTWMDTPRRLRGNFSATPPKVQGDKVPAFRAYFYTTDELKQIHKQLGIALHHETLSAIKVLEHSTTDPLSAQVFVVVLSSRSTGRVMQSLLLESLFRQLPYWNDGKNHVIVDLTTEHSHRDLSHFRFGTGTIIAQPNFQSFNLRTLDVILPIISLTPNVSLLSLPEISPVRRSNIFTFWGELPHSSRPPLAALAWSWFCGQDSKLSNVEIQCSCSGEPTSGPTSEWLLCSSSEERLRKLHKATFTLIPTPADDSFVSTGTFQIRFSEALQAGSIPVILGTSVILPFGDTLNWDKAVIFLSYRMLQDVASYLEHYNDHDLFEMKRAGRILWTTYMSSHAVILETLLLVIRLRSSEFRSLPARETITHYNGSMYVLSAGQASPTISGTVLSGLSEQRLDLQYPVDPFHHYTSTPFQPAWAPDILIQDKALKEELGGNFPPENITVVMIMFNRLETLATHVMRLKDVPFIDRILILWDTPNPLTELQTRLNSNGKLRFIRAGLDSLNNRFMPFDLIRTEAVLILDDDIMPPCSYLLDAFQLWRQNRDQIVGVAPRGISKTSNNSWLYSSTDWQYSMILTQLMIIHKYYLFLYTNYMPVIIRTKIDEWMNCEDIAMNFLVAHITRKPPLKIGSADTFRCSGPGCQNKSLSGRKTHYTQRTKCVQYFSKVYGYMPLLYSGSVTTMRKRTRRTCI